MEHIEVNNIYKSFDGKSVLKNFSIRIPIGQTTAIMAPSGCGKTTLLRILMGLESVDSGNISGLDNLKKSAVFQEDRLCENLNAVSNIRLVNPKLTLKEVLESMQNMMLYNCENQSVCELSGGMRRRVAILRAIMAQWDILFLDEPFKGLDTKTKQQVMEQTRQTCLNRTVILVTHNISEAKIMGASQIVSIK